MIQQMSEIKKLLKIKKFNNIKHRHEVTRKLTNQVLKQRLYSNDADAEEIELIKKELEYRRI